MLAEQTGVILKVVPINDRGEILFDEFRNLLGPKTRLVSVAHVSNALGTVLPVEQIVATAKLQGIPVLLDGAQGIPHQHVDVMAIDCDFYAFSGHKMCGPTGMVVLYGREELLEKMPPYQGGGDIAPPCGVEPGSKFFRPQMKLSLPTWSTTPILFHGRCSRNKRA